MFCYVHSEVGYELVLGTSWLGYELAWYDLVRVRVDWKPVNLVKILSVPDVDGYLLAHCFTVLLCVCTSLMALTLLVG